MQTDLRTNIAELDVPALEAALEAIGSPRFHARQIFTGYTGAGWWTSPG